MRASVISVGFAAQVIGGETIDDVIRQAIDGYRHRMSCEPEAVYLSPGVEEPKGVYPDIEIVRTELAFPFQVIAGKRVVL
jgi:hypothetical protein